jgi:hypothetical protein
LIENQSDQEINNGSRELKNYSEKSSSRFRQQSISITINKLLNLVDRLLVPYYARVRQEGSNSKASSSSIQ